MRWEDERYVRLYVRDTPEWTLLSWQARAVFYELLRKVDRAGVLALGKSGLRGVAGLLRVPLEVVEPAMAELEADGCVVRSESGLVIPGYLAAQEATQSDRLRKAEQRARARELALDSHESGQAVTNRDGESQNVTKCHERSRGVPSGHERSQPVTPCRAVPSHTDPENPPVSPRGSVTDEPPAEVLGLSASPTGGGEVETQQPSNAAPAPAAEPDQPAAPLATEAPDAAEAKPAPKATPKAARATRCPTSVDPAAPAWLAERGIPGLTSADGPEVVKMLDHFGAQGGQRGAKVDWPATWRNWRREAERRGGRSSPAPWARPVQPYVPPPRRAPPPPIDDRDDLPPF